jgi:hypothetical protein
LKILDGAIEYQHAVGEFTPARQVFGAFNLAAAAHAPHENPWANQDKQQQ